MTTLGASVEQLTGRHFGDTAYIVGRGPSLLRLTPEEFGPGPVIAINYAIVQIRRLRLSNPLYTMQQDACLVEPVPPEILLLSRHLSAGCWTDYPDRYLFSILGKSSMSAPCAVRIALLMGAAAVVMLAHDAYRNGSAQTVTPDDRLEDGSIGFPGYLQGAEQSEQLAARAGVPIRWLSAVAA
jgi:hypothetical protein